MNEPVLQLAGVRRTYATKAGPLEVLKGVDLEVRAGEIVALIGPSGSGKSSLLHAAGLLEAVQGGEVRLDGRPVAALDDSGRTALRLARIGFVYQFHHLLPEFSALDNVALPARIAGLGAAEARLRARGLLEQVGLGTRLDHQPAQLSGGEQQRVAIARALTNRPGLVIADEPTGNLDPGTSDTVFGLLRELTCDSGAAALVATHNHDLAGRMDRAFRLVDGRLEPV